MPEPTAPSSTVRLTWLQTLRVYCEPASLRMLTLGFSAGLPLLLVLGTLSFRLREAGIDRSTIGYLSWVGLAYGFAGSSEFGNQSSGDWFAAGQKDALSDIQTDSAFYSVYENTIFLESGRTVYGHPYSDRMTAYAVAVDVVQHEGKPIDTLKITIYDPQAGTPKPVGEANHTS